MTSRWIKELEEIFNSDDALYWKDFLPTLKRVDSLLREAMLDVDDDKLSDRIRQEVKSELNRRD